MKYLSLYLMLSLSNATLFCMQEASMHHTHKDVQWNALYEQNAIEDAQKYLNESSERYTSPALALQKSQDIHNNAPYLSITEIAGRIGTDGCITLLKNTNESSPESVQEDIIALFNKMNTFILQGVVLPYNSCIQSFVRADIPLPQYYSFKVPVGFAGIYQAPLMKTLLSAGANPNALHFRNSILTGAVIQNNIKSVKYLVKAGANIDYIPEYPPVDFRNPLSSRTALSTAIRHKYNHIAHYLLSRGANPNIASEPAKDTPLMRALNPRLVSHLLECGADTTMRNAFNQTALDIARERADNAFNEKKKNKYLKIVSMLEKHTK